MIGVGAETRMKKIGKKERDMTKKTKKRRTISTSIMYAIVVLTILNTVALPVIGAWVRRGTAVEDYGRLARYLAVSIANSRDGDRLLASFDAEYEDDYWDIVHRELRLLSDNIPEIRFVYIIRQYQGTLFEYYLAHGHPSEFDGFYFFRYVEPDPEVYTVDTVRAFQEGVVINTGIHDAGEFGTLLSAWAPIRDSQGNIIALAGVDIDVAVINAVVLYFAMYFAAAGLFMSLVIAILLRTMIKGSLNNSLKRIMDVDPTFANKEGLEFWKNPNNDRGGDDEIGVLYSHFSVMINTFSQLMNDMERVTKAHLSGKASARIDESSYTGGNLEVVREVNKILDTYVDNFKDIAEVMSQYSNGDFTAALPHYSGEWDWLNDSMGGLKVSLDHVSKEINGLSNRAVKGDFKTPASSLGRDKGQWTQMVDGLNALVEAVEKPLHAIEENATDMSKGHFRDMTGQFEGEFEVVKQSINESNRRLRAYIGEISEILTAMAAGDLTVRLERSYIGEFMPIKTAIDTILTSLNRSMRQIMETSREVRDGSDALSRSSELLSQGTNTQSEAIKALYVSLEEMDAKTRNNSGRANDADTLSQTSNNHAAVGNKEMKTMLLSMEEIKTSSDNISKIIKVIEDIAFQTNLLALNAAVESARAGEHGRGFAVVAEEVRALAERSSQAAKETTGLIENSMTQVDTGSSIVQSTATSLEAIVQSVQQVSELISQIAVVSSEQAQAISEIIRSIDGISQVVTSNMNISQESSEMADKFAQQTQKLLEFVNIYKIR